MTMIPVPPGHLATIVTSLEMLTPRPAATAPVRSALRLEHWRAPVDLARYGQLFRDIGTPWLWQGRLKMSDAELAEILDNPATEVHVATRRDGTPVGLLELDFRVANEFEIAYFGLAPGMTGNGHGAWLMAHCLRLGWSGGTSRRPITRGWVHTCDLDHPSALGFYQREGFTPFRREVEILPDPRQNGIHPRETAPHIPQL
jgi:GNAT superfamily N-acetyltransferase